MGRRSFNRILIAGQSRFDGEPSVPETVIRCTRCHTYQPATAFATGQDFYCKTCVNAYGKQRYSGRHRRSYDLRRNYGMTHEEYDALWAMQGGLCAACGQADTRVDPRTQKQRYLSVDHDHATGVIRGLLCQGCNAALGQLGEDPSRIRALADYAERHQHAEAA